MGLSFLRRSSKYRVFISDLKSYQNTIESTGITTALHMTQDSDTGIVLQAFIDDLLDILGGDGMSFPVHGTLSHNDNVQALASRALLQI